MKKILLLVLAGLVFTPLWSQNVVPCFTDEHQEEFLQKHPEMRDDFEQAYSNLLEMAEHQTNEGAEGTQADVLTIPVVFHIISSTPYDNIAKSQVMDAMRILNEDFRRLNPDASNTRPLFQGRASDIEVEFALAKKAPDGSCTDGINRIQSPLSVSASPRDQIKTLVQWDPKKYLNVWVVRSIENSGSTAGLILGYANFPWMPASKDGIVIRHDALGRIGTARYDGRTLTHEVGHYLGLLHTFQGGCNQGDGINDTPPVASASNGCNTSQNSCSSDSPDLPDMVENYMDYSDGACQNMFTTGQRGVMRSALNSYASRKTLWTTSNLDETGVNNSPACTPTALFTQPRNVVCEGGDIQFADETEDGDPTTYLWTLPGGTPSTSTDPNPLVTYNYPGVYDVTLTVSNSAGTSTKISRRAVTVRSPWTQYNTQWSEDFESKTMATADLSVQSMYDTSGFQITNLAASSGSSSLFLDNFNAPEPNDIDLMISPNIKTLFSKDLALSFDYAYTQKTGSETGFFRVYISTDCGETWAMLRAYNVFQLRTADPTTSPFIPDASQWKRATINMNLYEDKGPILLKFEFSANGGNNFFLDNINVTSSNIGLEESEFAHGLGMYPNPASNSLTLTFEGGLEQDAGISFSDLSGRVIRTLNAARGATDLHIENLNLPSGLYIVSIKSGEETVTKKLIVE